LEEEDEEEDIKFKLSCDAKPALTNGNIVCKLTATPPSSADGGKAEVKYSFVVNSDTYFHKHAVEIYAVDNSKAWHPLEAEQVFELTISPEIYMPVWKADKVIDVVVTAEGKVGDAKTSFVEMEHLSFPIIPVTVTCNVDEKPVICDVSFTSPEATVTGKFKVDADEATICQVNPAPPGGKKCAEESKTLLITPKITGNTATASFSLDFKPTDPTSVVKVMFDAPGKLDGHGSARFKQNVVAAVVTAVLDAIKSAVDKAQDSPSIGERFGKLKEKIAARLFPGRQ
jgi:hypothetical protein